MIYSELSYSFKDTPTPHHFQHIADWQDQQRLARIAKMAERYDAWERSYLATLQMDVREVIERADRASKGEIQ